jgi:DNA-binding HxlR family transcriptional regulator
LEEKGVVLRTVMPTSPPSVEYALTELGAELVPVINVMVKVGTRLRNAVLRYGERASELRSRSGTSAHSLR